MHFKQSKPFVLIVTKFEFQSSESVGDIFTLQFVCADIAYDCIKDM